MEYFLTVLGLICFFEGLPYFAMPERMKRWLEQLGRMEGNHLRVMGGVLMVLGLFFVYLGRRNGG